MFEEAKCQEKRENSRGSNKEVQRVACLLISLLRPESNERNAIWEEERQTKKSLFSPHCFFTIYQYDASK